MSLKIARTLALALLALVVVGAYAFALVLVTERLPATLLAVVDNADLEILSGGVATLADSEQVSVTSHFDAIASSDVNGRVVRRVT
jgi:hypothetical protein